MPDFMKRLLLCALVGPTVAYAQQLAPPRTGATTTTLFLPKRTYLYQQLSDTANCLAAQRLPYRLTVQVVRAENARWLLVTRPNHHRCKVGVDYGPDPTYYISTATAAKAKRLVLSSL
jgi:hypothetical protein